MVWRPPKVVVVLSAVGTCIGAACMIKDYVGGRMYTDPSNVEGKVMIVTGANTGIGKETARELAKRGAKVVMACRDMDKCEKTRQEIVIETNNKFVYCRKCDLASQDSIRRFAEKFRTEHGRLDVLVNNAGVMRCPRTLTREGIELQLGVNHMGHFLLTNLLLDLLVASAPSRVVNVSSVAHSRATLDKTDLNAEAAYDPADAYARSKLANVLFTRELATRLEGTGVTANALHPGLVDTEIIRHMSFFGSTVSALFVKPFVWPFVKSPRQGAQTSVFAAVDPGLEKVTGKYFNDCKEHEVSVLAQDPALSRWLWLVSEKWTRLNVPARAASAPVR